MKKRRYHMTKEQGEIASLALASAIPEIEKIMKHDPSAYWKWVLERSKQLKQELDTYHWEVPEQ